MTKKLQNFLPVVILFLALLIFGSIFLNVLQNNNDEAILTGVTATFGGETFQIGGFLDHKVNFSFLNLLAFSLPALVSIIFVITTINDKKTSMSKLIFGLLLTLSFALSVVLFFQLPENTTRVITILGNEGTANYGSQDLAIGAILGYVLAILGSITSLIYSLLQFEK